MKPIYLFADSQILFWREGRRLFLGSLREQIESRWPRAAYVGASNGDDPSYFSIFRAAMEGVGIGNCCPVSSALTQAEASFVSESDLILLAGGEVERGWDVFRRNGLGELIVRRYWEGAILIGVSAGAVQLGWYGRADRGPAVQQLIRTFGLVPFMIDAHDEKNDWRGLRQAVRLAGAEVAGIGIPTGGGLVYRPDQTLEPLRHPAVEFSLRGGELVSSLLLPQGLEATADVVLDKWVC